MKLELTRKQIVWAIIIGAVLGLVLAITLPVMRSYGRPIFHGIDPVGINPHPK
jgi:hypothetical protein